jgi:CHAT domain-containing protein
MATGRWTTLALAGCCLLSAVAPAGADTAADEGAVRRVVERMFSAYAKKDLDGFMAAWSSASPGYAIRRKNMQAIFAETGPIEVKSLALVTASVRGDTARVRVRADLAGNAVATDKPYHQFGRLNRVLTLAREEGVWKIYGYVPAEAEFAARLGAINTREERQHLLAGEDKDLVTAALALAMRDHALDLARGRKSAETVACLDLAVEIAVGLGDKVVQADVLMSYGYYREIQAQYADALAQTKRALALYRETKDRIGEAKALYNLGNQCSKANQLPEALAWYDASLVVSREAKFPIGESYALQNSAMKLEAMDRYAEALERYEAALALKIKLGDKVAEIKTRSAMANLLQKIGRYREALPQYEAFLDLARQLRDVDREAEGLMQIGNVYSSTARYADALAVYERCLEAARNRRDRVVEEAALSNIGLVYSETGRLTEAVANQEIAVKLAHEIGDRKREAMALLNLGAAYSDVGRSPEARQRYEASLLISRELGDRVGQMSSFANIANLDRRAGKYAEALVVYEGNVKTAQEMGLRSLEVTGRNNLGMTLLQLGRYSKAGEQFEVTLRIGRETNSRGDEAFALGGSGEVLLMQGRYREALRQHQAALEIYRSIGDRRGESAALANTGLVYKSMGRNGEALTRIQASLVIVREIGDRVGEVATLNNLALTLAQAGRFDDSARQGEAARDLAQAQGRPRSAAKALKSLGDCAVARGHADEAVRHYEAALVIFRGLKIRSDEASALTGLAWAYSQLGRDADAIRDYEASRAILRELGLSAFEAGGLVKIGEILVKQKRYEQAGGVLREALAISEPLGDAANAGQCYGALGALYAGQKQWPEAIAAYRRAVANTEAMRDDLRDTSLRASFLHTRIAPYAALTVSLLEQAGPTAAADAFQAAEQAKARALVDLFRQGKADVRKGMAESERREDERLQAAVTALSVQGDRMRTDGVEVASQERLARQLADARGEHDLFRQRVFLAHPELQTRQARFEPATLVDLNRTLFAREPGLCVLSYLVADEEVLIFALRRGSDPAGAARLNVTRVPVGTEDLAEAVDTFRRACQRPGGGAPDGEQIYGWLLAPAAEYLEGTEHVVVIPDGVLHTLPFQALKDGAGKYLVERVSVSYAPSVTALEKMVALAEKRRHERSGTGSVLTVGRPAFGGALPDLPASETEAKAVAALYPGRAKLLVGSAADKAAVLSALGAAQVVHLATHGLLNEASPLYSAIALTPTIGLDDGRLYALDLLDLDLRADLVVLSACETALGQQVKGEGILGLAWALFVAGAPSSIVAQWSVADESTAALMAEFHVRLAAGTTKAEALRQAQLALIKDRRTRHPFFWAPFVLVGDGGG